MRSSELARLAGVSVRTLRHYHQIAVLTEPERTVNGYRDYDVHHLVRVLRIRRLAALGIALERMPSILDESDADADALFDDLDAELAGQIDRLTRQREVLERLRAHRAFPDLPPELAHFQAAFEGVGLTREMARIDRDQALLVAQLVGEDGMAQLTRFYEKVTAPAVIGEMVAAMDQLGALDDTATDEEVAAVTEQFASAVRPLLADFDDLVPAFDARQIGTLLGAHSDAVLNETQRRALRLLEAQLLSDAE